MESDFINRIKQLLTKKSNTFIDIKAEILDIKEIEYQEYNLTLKFGQICICNGVYTNTDIKLQKGNIINNYQLSLSKSDTLTKFNIKIFEYLSDESDSSKQELSNNKNNNIDENGCHINLELEKYNLEPYNLPDFFSLISNSKNDYFEDIFIVTRKFTDRIELLCPINLEKYIVYLKYISDGTPDLKIKDILYINNYLLENNNIICNNLTTVKKATDYEIFHKLQIKLDNKSNLTKQLAKEIKPIKCDKEIQIKCLFAKVILKDIKKKQVKIMDIFNRIIDLSYDKFKYLDLFDIFFITNCKIYKSKNDIFSYNLKSSNDSIIHFSKKLFFDKRITINNISILDVYFPDFQKNGNFYNKINIMNYDMEINNNHHIYYFIYNNEPFNEIIPYGVSIKNEKINKSLKFFIVNNLMYKINIFINYNNEDACCKDICYYNLYDEVPCEYNLEIDKNIYNIENYNSFDTINRISFILLNVPSDENVNKIKKNNDNDMISCQIWFTPKKELIKGNLVYFISQILDINEAKPKEYFTYNLKGKDFLIFENFYFDLLELSKRKNNDIINYYDEFSKKVKNYNDIYELLNNKYNIDFNSFNLDYLSFKIYISISLFDALTRISYENKKSENKKLSESLKFIHNFDNLIKQLISLKKELTYHQKMRIINCFIYNYFNSLDKLKKPSKLLTFFDKTDDNAYKLAFKFNIDVINNLTEKSALTQGFLQLDSYILKNYYFNGNMTYSLSNEPIIMMKNHLLYNYENFILIVYENSYNSSYKRGSQDKPNRITIINEKNLFENNYSEQLCDKNNALPISMEFFHEKDSHSKKLFKNLKIQSPLFCYKYNRIDILEEPEDGRFIESIIGDKDFIALLKNFKNNLGELMKVEYFIGEDFEVLNKKCKDLIINNNSLLNNEKSPIRKMDNDIITISKNKKIRKKKASDLETLEDFENYYLFDGNFVYPDSLPSHDYYDDNRYKSEKYKKIAAVEKQFLKKYEKAIKRAKDAHYNTINNLLD